MGKIGTSSLKTTRLMIHNNWIQSRVSGPAVRYAPLFSIRHEQHDVV
jgi:hypothetical protein